MSEKSKENKMSIEECFDYLDGALTKLEDEDLPLEETFVIYEEAMKVVKECSAKIDAVEKKVKVLDSKGNLSNLDQTQE